MVGMLKAWETSFFEAVSSVFLNHLDRPPNVMVSATTHIGGKDGSL